MKTYRRLLKVLDVAAEKQDQIFIVETQTLPIPATKIVDVAKFVIFDRVIIFRNVAIVQGRVHKRIQFVDTDTTGYKRDYQVDVPFHKKVELPGLTPTVTIGQGNRAVLGNNIVEIGPDGEGASAGIEVQLYVKEINNVEELVPPLPSTTLIEKIDIDFLIKISKYKQVKMDLPAPSPVFECKNVLPCRTDC